MTKTVLIATKKPFTPSVRDMIADEMKKADLQVEVLEGYSDQSALVNAAAKANGIIVRSDPVTAEVIDASPNLELIVRAGAGYDNVDVEYAKQKGIIVENTPGQNANAVAELTLELMLSSGRPLNGKIGIELKGKTLGVHGFGNIGRIVARLARAFGMHVKVYDMNIDTNIAREHGVTIADSQEELYENSDFVSIHVPETTETTRTIDRHLLGLMSNNGVLVNTARAGIINEKDLLFILEERPGFRYATDVAPSGDTMAIMKQKYKDRVISTPKKQGAQTLEANMNAGLAAARQTIDFFNKGDTAFCVYKLIPHYLSTYTVLAIQLGKLNEAFVAKPREVQITAYGELHDLGETIAEYVLKGLFTKTLGEKSTPGTAAAYAKEHGIKIVTREPDNSKGYGNAITVDFIAGDGTSHSTRGRIDEGQMEASRVGEFKSRMPLDPGLYVIATYKEGPGMADKPGHLLSDNGYNRTRLGAGPNIDGTTAQAFFVVDKKGMPFDRQMEEVKMLAKDMKSIEDVYDVKVINLK